MEHPEANPVLKMRVVDLSRDTEDTVSTGIVTIWRPGNSWASLKERDKSNSNRCSNYELPLKKTYGWKTVKFKKHFFC